MTCDRAVTQATCHGVQKKGKLFKGRVWRKCPWKDQTFVWISQIREGVMDREEGTGAWKGETMRGEKMKGIVKPQKQTTC